MRVSSRNQDLGRKHLRRLAICPLLLLIFSLVGCSFFFPGRSGKNDKRSTQAAKTSTDGGSAESPAGNETPAQVQVLAIGKDMIGALHQDLTASGLTSTQADIITNHSEKHLTTVVGTLAVGTTALQLAETASAESAPVAIAGPTIIEGALRALMLPGVDLAAASSRQQVVEVIVASLFKSLNGRTAVLDEKSVVMLAGQMITKAMTNLDEAGLREGDAAEAARAVTAGAVGSLEKSAIKEASLGTLAKTVVQSSVASLAVVNFGSNVEAARLLRSSAIGKSTEGAVGRISTLSLASEASVGLIGELSSTAMLAARDLNKVSGTTSVHMQTAISKVAFGSVSGLKNAGLLDERLPAAVQSITGALVTKLEAAGLGEGELRGGVAAVAGGSIAGASMIRENEITAKKLVADVVASTTKNLASVKLSLADKAAAVGDIVGQSLAALPAAGVTSQANRELATTQALEGALDGLAAAGLNDLTLLALSLETIARATTTALPAAGYAAGDYQRASSSVAKTGIELVTEKQLSKSADALSSAASSLAKGAIEGMSRLQSESLLTTAALKETSSQVLSASMDALVKIKNSSVVTLSTGDLGVMASAITARTLEGLAVGGMAANDIVSTKQVIVTQVVGDLRSQGVGEAQLSYVGDQIESEATKAVTLANKLAAPDSGFVLCSEQYSNELSDSSFFSRLPAGEDALYCRTSEGTCPKARTSESFKVQWLLSAIKLGTGSSPALCQLIRTPQTLSLPSSFMITTLPTAIATPSVAITWGAASGSQYYEYTIAADAGCYAPIVRQQTTATSVTTSSLADGSYYLCVKAFNTAGQPTAASNNGLAFAVDTTAPVISGTGIVIDSDAALTYQTAVTLGLAASGASDMYITNTSGCASGGSWQPYATSAPWALGQTYATATVYVKFKDTAGNESSCVSDTIVHASQGPSAASINIDAGASYATSTSVTLTLAATGASEVYVTNTAGCSAGGSWESFTPSKAWTLAQTNATATVYVKYRDAFGTESSCIHDTVTHDNTAPSSTSISIDAGATYATTTSAGLTLAATGASEMYVTNTAACGSGGTWEAYATSKAWTLAQTNGTATVYIKFRDAAGNPSSCINDTISHDNIAPTSASISINAGAAYTTTTAVTLTLGASGATKMYVTNIAGCASGGSWESLTASKTWTLGQSEASASVYVQYKDEAGNTSSCIHSTIVHDNTPPSGGAISISSGSSYTASSSATLGLSATDATEMYITNVSGCASGGSWEGYASTKTGWSLGQTNSTATVYVKYRDGAQNETSCLSDTIIHDNQSPPTMTVLHDGDSSTSTNTSPLLVWDAVSDSGSGISNYEAAIGTSAGATDVQGWVSLGAGTSGIVTGLSLSSGPTYYASVRAVDGAGNPGGQVNGDGFTVRPWQQQAFIKAVNAGASDNFGVSVALSLNTLAVGAWKEDSSQVGITNGSTASADDSVLDSGAVYVYKKSGTSWAQEAYIKAANAGGSDNFGVSLSLYANTLAVGAWKEDSSQATINNNTTASTNNSRSDSGAVYVYNRTGTNWTQQAYIKAANSDAGDFFAVSMSLFADTLVVGAQGEASQQTVITNGTDASTDNTRSSSGAAYVYRRTGVAWAQEAYLKAASPDSNDQFGAAVSLYSDTIAVAARYDDSSQTTLTNGTSGTVDNLMTNSGAVYVYTRSGTNWAQEAYLKATNANSSDLFGTSVALYGDTLAVGATFEAGDKTTVTNGTAADSDNSKPESGAVYVYQRNAGNWDQQAYIKASNSGAWDKFGERVSLYDDSLVVRSSLEDSGQSTITNGTLASMDDSAADSGAAYIYRRTASSWVQEAYLKGSNNSASDGFSDSLVIYGDTMAVGAIGEDDGGSDAGAVYIYTRTP